jgi:hypothetical protein
MMRSQWFSGVAVTVLAIIAGTISFNDVNRRYAEAIRDRDAAGNAAANANSAPATSSTACVDSDGAWKNWSFPNVPMLSPKCE